MNTNTAIEIDTIENPAILPVPANEDVGAWDGFTFASFFACAGGADYGMVAAGARPVYANEFRPPVARLHQLNHGQTVDTRSIVATDTSDYGNPTVIVGGPPCQPFSRAGLQLGGDDPRGQMGPVFATKIMEAKPAAFICENVPPLLTHRKFSPVFAEMLRIWGNTYRTVPVVLNAADYGVPQTRERAFIIGYHADLGMTFDPRDLPRVRTRATIRGAIGDLLSRNAVTLLRDPGRALTGDEYDGSVFPPRLSTDRVRGWEAQSYTVVAKASSVPLHPEPVSPTMVGKPGIAFNAITKTYHRRMTVRECARIQTFPDSFSFGCAGLTLAYDVVGNAIPPLLMERIAGVVRADLVKVGVVQTRRPMEARLRA